MPAVRVVFLPALLRPDDLAGRTVVVFDVLRATTTMAAALSNGAKEIWAYDSLDAVRDARKTFTGPVVTVGELFAVRPEDFNYGNSPCDFTPAVCENKTILMATTNGTRALVAARSAADLFTGALVNAVSTGKAVAATGRPVTLLCSGTQGLVSTEDALGAGAVIAAIPDAELENDSAKMALKLWQASEATLYDTLFDTFGGHNIRRAKLTPDIAFAASVNRFDIVCRVRDHAGQLIVTSQT